jgi:hypothetical protein
MESAFQMEQYNIRQIISCGAKGIHILILILYRFSSEREEKEKDTKRNIGQKVRRQ